ncbi:hypothetical protein EDD58_101599 [Hazenella coriacea]|uniref:Uncharacterized protein n=2 Tax=Hazenella coriacea TaxID=1179467 RepID=A0A4R3LB57_9BACL|nr:hypothetical protein EDD58_101599 [Hazenella coriacea]
MIYNVVLIMVFLIGRWVILDQFDFASGQPSELGKDWLVGWVNGFSVLFLFPFYWWVIKKVTHKIRTQIQKRFLRIFTYIYSYMIMVLLFTVIYYAFILSF